MMQKFLEGGWEWMLPVLLCLVIGLAVAIERIPVSYTHLIVEISLFEEISQWSLIR